MAALQYSSSLVKLVKFGYAKIMDRPKGKMIEGPFPFFPVFYLVVKSPYAYLFLVGFYMYTYGWARSISMQEDQIQCRFAPQMIPYYTNAYYVVQQDNAISEP
jgi:hypothetical protein